jgi:hypothetical protein
MFIVKFLNDDKVGTVGSNSLQAPDLKANCYLQLRRKPRPAWSGELDMNRIQVVEEGCYKARRQIYRAWEKIAE